MTKKERECGPRITEKLRPRFVLWEMCENQMFPLCIRVNTAQNIFTATAAYCQSVC